MPIVGSTIGTVTPSTQTINWVRGTDMPLATDLIVRSSNAELVEVYIQFIGTSVNWFDIEGYSGTSFFIPDFSSSETLVLNLNNLNLLVNNNYKAVIGFVFSKSEGANKEVTVEVNLSISGSFGIQTDKSNYKVVFNRANNALSGETNVEIINNTESRLLSFWQPTNIFEPKNNILNDFLIQDNTILSIATNPDIPYAGNINHQCKVLGPSGEFLTGFAIDLVILNDNGIGASPDNLFFEVIKNTDEKTLMLSVLNPLNLNFTVEHSDWLESSVLSGNATIDINVITKTDNLEPGNHNGFVKIVFDSGFINIPVQLLLKQFIKIEISDTNFCLDIPAMFFTKINENAAYVKVSLKVLYNVMGKDTLVEQFYIIPYINDEASFELGKKVHSYFPRYRSHLFNISMKEFMRVIFCDLIIEEQDIEYKNIMTENIQGLRFFPGKRPNLFPVFSNYGHRKKNRGSQLFISNNVDSSVILERKEIAGNKILSYGEAKINLYDFPVVFRPVHIHWENGNLVPEWFTFTGEYTISSDFTHLSSKNVLNSLIEKFQTTKIKRLTINTGFIMVEEIELIEEMIMNKLAFIKIENKIYQCYNSTSKVVLQSSRQSTIDRDLEFIIVEQ